MAVTELWRAVADPDHVARRRIPIPGHGIDAREGLLIPEQQRLMAGVEIGGAQLGVALEIETASPHEVQRLRNAIGQLLVTPRLRGILEEAEHPLVNAAEIGETASCERAQQVERPRRLAIRH